MKKLLSNIWIKMFVTILCIISIVSTTVCTIGIIALAEYRSKSEIRQEIFNTLSDNYAVSVLAELYQNDLSSLSPVERQLAYRNLGQTNWHYALVKSTITDPFQFEKMAKESNLCTYLHGTANIWEHDTRILQGERTDGILEYVSYSTDSIYEALFGGSYIWVDQPQGQTYTFDIEQIVYLPGTNLFYAGLDNGEYLTLTNFTAVYFNGEHYYSIDYALENDEYYAMGTHEDVAYGDNVETDDIEIADGRYDLLPYYGVDFDDGRFHTGDPRLAGVEINGYPDTIIFTQNIENLIRYCGSEELEWYLNSSELSFGEIFNSVQRNEIMSNYIDVQDYSVENGTISYVYLEDTTDPEIYWIVSYVDDEIKEGDLFYVAEQWLDVISVFWDYQIWWLLLSVAVLILCVVFLTMGAGMNKKAEGICLRWYDKIPYGLFLCGIICMELIACACLVWTFDAISSINYTVLFSIMIADVVIMAFFAIGFIISTVARIRSHHFFRYTVCYWIFRPCRFVGKKIMAFNQRTLLHIRENWPLFWRVLLVLIGAYVIEGLVLLIAASASFELAVCVGIVLEGAKTAFVMWCVMQLGRLQKGSERIARGNLTEPIDTKGLMWDFKKHAENINKVGDGIAAAVEQQMKSERFKTELITNVSHDIKTPLTSIINYVDLIKKEQIENPVLIEYVEVLDRQSGRLKKLIDDLMEASKASTGNLSVQLEVCDVTVLLAQMIGEFEEKAQKNNLKIVEECPTEAVHIMADSRHIWRVLDNLLNNICKYAMPGTRVYISLSSGDGNVYIIFKNISKTQLNISSDELMERFVRGDSSRNTEGSGLGLSIAQSLTALMNGTLKLEIDGDLFKVTLCFPEKK